jgi:uncharacterized protein
MKSLAVRGIGAWIVLVLVVCLAATLAAQPAPPALTRPVNDFADVIDPQSESAMDTLIRALQQASGDVVVVATVDTFQPYADINEYAVKMFENGGRGIGQRGKDNGLLVLLAVKDRRVRVEVGYDLEQFITDGFAGQVSRQTMAPEFEQGRYGPGLLAGVSQLVERIAERRNVTLQGVPATSRQRARDDGFGGAWIIVLFAVIVIINAIAGRLGRRRGFRGGGWGGPFGGWSSGVGPFGGGFGRGGGFGGGGFGGGFGGFGGGRSGGGGGGAGW